MEGWDGTIDGGPSDLTIRRWQKFGASGAKLVWGGEAVAVREAGRANPNQLLLTESTRGGIATLRDRLVGAHRQRFGSTADSDLFVGLQLTHSGRFARPHVKNRPEPLAACTNPVLDRRFPGGVTVLTDSDIARIADHFVRAAKWAAEAGFAFVDIKHCHGYLGHELLGARRRPGAYGGSLENRTRFLRDIVDGIHATVPRLRIGVRLSVFDTVAFRRDDRGAGIPENDESFAESVFGLLEGNGFEAALHEPSAVVRMLKDRGVQWVCVSAGSPYYNPHVQRPALFPPIDGYDPPEDPLEGVARQIDATARLKALFPDVALVGSAYSYLQEWLPHVAEYNVRHGLTDFVGLGRVALAYPDLPADVLAGRPLRRKSFCRTFSDCTTGPRLGLVSGCYPLDPLYVHHPDAEQLKKAKAKLEKRPVL